MGQTPDKITQKLAERLCWEVARRGESMLAPLLSEALRTPRYGTAGTSW